MYTDCPACERQFRIKAEHLNAANGWVKCGFCGETFNALERLRDKPAAKPTASPRPSRQAKDKKKSSEPERDLPAVEKGDTTQPLLTQSGMPVEEVAVAAETDAAVIAEAKAGAEVEAEVAVEKILPASQDEAIAAFDFSMADAPVANVKKTLFVRFLQPGILLLLLLVLSVQLAWFNRDSILKSYPQWHPWAEKLCLQLDCTIVRFRDVTAIKVLNRDVRIHPRYENALLVNATIVNKAKYIQPFPVIQLTLFNTDGKVTSLRDFKPRDYLEKSYLEGPGMQVDIPVHFVLEVSGFSSKAEGFEFNFM